MALIRNSYGKGRVRIMRVKRDSARHEVRELTVEVLLTGAFDASYTEGDNRSVIATDSIKNIVNFLARDHVGAENEVFAGILARHFLDRYAHVSGVSVTASETKWSRIVIEGAPHDHSFVLDGNGRPTVKLTATREGTTLSSGVSGFTFLKTTQSAWEDYWFDEATTLKPTPDRLFATAMDASWLWSTVPGSYESANQAVLDSALKVFATTFSPGVQNTLYLMGEAVLAAVPDIREISIACPNKHYLPIDLSPFGRAFDGQVFTPTDEPHGQIACTIGRG
ncbi:factor-independent urate hydroxylase [Ancylobacter amanitiformis]|uniref:Uricase n=1 Tax=Ancylobacter amanitiformis TaxID=217069 RepID=A0ABU0LRR3_9HYPH|nr:urate oxidase [Ancylobacter amanitiformis]MDQ0511376.1 urate oxidase [Ancylobacter amanitiformis]